MDRSYKSCLSESFFQELNTTYENCYKINPNPSEAFLERMQIIEIEARKLRDSLEELQIASYRYWEPERLTENERIMLRDYDRTALIVKEFMPYLTAAFVLTMPPLQTPDPFANAIEMSSLATLNHLTSNCRPTTPAEFPTIEVLPERTLANLDVYQESSPGANTLLPDISSDFPIESLEEIKPMAQIAPIAEVKFVAEIEPVAVAVSVVEPAAVVAAKVEPVPVVEAKVEAESSHVITESCPLVEVHQKYERAAVVAPEILSEIEFEQLVKDTCLTWMDVQSCYPETSIVKFLQQVMGTATICFNSEYNPVFRVQSMKGTYKYEYELDEHAFRQDLDSILNERVVQELQYLVDDLIV